MDDIGRFVRLTSGRLPETCTPERCEVVQLGGTGKVPSTEGLRLVRVGEGVLTSALPFGRLPGEDATRIGDSFGVADQPPFLVAEGFDEFSTLPALDGFYRTYAWTVPLSSAGVHPWEVDEFDAAAARARSTLRSESLFLDLAAPVDELAAARESGQVAGKRLLLVGGQAAALLLAFAILAAAGMRRDVEGAWQRLTWFGARRYQLGLLSGAETGAAALAGVIVGWAAGVVAGRAARRSARALPWERCCATRFSRAPASPSPRCWPMAATVVLLLALRAPAAPLGGLRVTALDVAALGALLAVLLALARGDADAGALAADGGTGTLLLLLPGLVTFVCAVACARLLGPGLRLLERVSRGSSPPVRLASLSLARSPGRAAVAVTFLVVSLGLGLFAAALPLDARRRARGAGGLRGSARLPGADGSHAVRARRAARRRAARRLRGARRGRRPGDPPDRHGGRRGPGDAARRPGRDARRRATGCRRTPRSRSPGPELPADAAELQLPVSVRGGNVALTAIVLTPGGRFARLPLGQTQGTKEVVLSAAVPPEVRGGRVVALSLARPDAVTGHGEIRRAGRRPPDPRRRSRADGEPILAGYDDWTGLDGVQAEDGGLRFLLTNEAANPRFQPRQPTDGEPVPVVVTPRLAARAGDGGVLPVRVASGQISGPRRRRRRPRPDRLGRRHPRRREHGSSSRSTRRARGRPCRTSCGSPGRSRSEPRSSARRSTSST